MDNKIKAKIVTARLSLKTALTILDKPALAKIHIKDAIRRLNYIYVSPILKTKEQ